jgi:hypothetical protein
MIKRSLALAFMSLIFILSACRGERGVPGPPGPAGPAGPGLTFQIIDVTVFPGDWLPLGNVNDIDFQLYAEYSAPELDPFAVDNALVIGYQLDGNTNYTLPNTINFGDYTREYSFYYGVNFLGFVVKDSDLQTTTPDGPVSFQVFVIDPSLGKKVQEDWTASELEAYLIEASKPTSDQLEMN